MDRIQVFQGIDVVWTMQVVGSDGLPALDKYTGDEPINGFVYSGDSSGFATTVFTFLPRWVVPNGGPLGKIEFPFVGTATAPVWPGIYKAICTLDGFAQALVQCEVELLASPAGSASLTGTLNRALADYGLLRRVARQAAMANVLLDPASPIGQFDDPLSRALLFMKIPLANPVVPSDDDVARVTDWAQLMDIAEYEFLDRLVGGAAVTAGVMTEQRWPDYSYRIDPQATLFMQQGLSAKRDYVRNVYGYGAARIRSGSINIGYTSRSCSYGEFS